MQHLVRATLVATALVLALSSTTTLAALSNPVTDWFVQAQRSVAAFSTSNQISAKQYALLGVAQLRALQLLQSQKSYKQAPSESKRLTLNTATQAFAAHQVLSALYPQRQTFFDTLLQTHTAGLSTAELDFVEGIAYAVAKRLIVRRIQDGATRWSRYSGSPGSIRTPGVYRLTPNQTFVLYPQLASVPPIAVPRVTLEKYIAQALAQKHVIPSDEYYAERDAIAVLGAKSSTNRTQYDTDSATFWADGANTSAIGGHWISIAYQVLPSDLDLLSTARIFAQIGAAAFDSSIAVWAVKYRAAFWRPITALRLGDPQRAPIPDWTPLLSTPAHPEFPSGHQATVGAILGVLQAGIGDAVKVTIGSEGLANVTRTYTSLLAIAKEVGDSRFYGGVHFQRSNEVGLELGRKVGAWIAKYLN